MHAGARVVNDSPCERRRQARLRRRAEFQHVYHHGERVGGRFMVVFATIRKDGRLVGARCGVTATRRLGSAVVRNRCKRRLRELFSGNRELLEGLDVDLVINARHGCADAPWRVLLSDYRRCVSRLTARLAGR
jgi:ribonuclease P protein component